MEPELSELIAHIHALLGPEPSDKLRDLLEETEAVDLAAVFFNLSIPEQQMVLGVMSPHKAAQVLMELDVPGLEKLAGEIPSERLADYIALMEPDEAADVIGAMPPLTARAVMAALPDDQEVEIDKLLAYGPESAGGIMDPDVVEVLDSQTVGEAVAEIRRFVEQVELDEFFSAFVVDRYRRLVGVVPNWKMLLADPEQKIEEIMIPDPVSVEAHVDQEEVSILVRDHDLVTLPVVDSHRHLIGRITVDDIVDVIHEEHTEDLGRFIGGGTDDMRHISIIRTLRDRAPWLFIALGGQIVAAIIMRAREDYLILIPQLAFFIPAVMAMGGNTGVQSASLVIRGLATGEVRLSHFWRRLLREFLVALLIGAVFAMILIGGGVAITGRWNLGVVVGLATMSTIVIASTGGMVIPMVLRRMGMDPALATGPFLTTMNDVLGVIVYLAIAYLVLF